LSLTIIACPQCRQPTAWADNPHRPFCSERCRLLDLGAWVEESYRLPELAASPIPGTPGEDKP
jgi:endogenous inhibitor of DNA gyrase (YacG/DUF329 family)